MFIKAECPIQLESGKFPPKGTSCILMRLPSTSRGGRVYLCEVSYSKTLYTLARRLEAWSKDWPRLREAILHDYLITGPDSESWRVRPWVFVPLGLRKQLKKRLSELAKASSDVGKPSMPAPKVTFLESVVPWRGKTTGTERHARRSVAPCPVIRHADSRMALPISVSVTGQDRHTVASSSPKRPQRRKPRLAQPEEDGPMWVFTKHGFFSAVCARQGDGTYGQPVDQDRIMVRARVRGHLEAPKGTLSPPARPERYPRVGRDRLWVPPSSSPSVCGRK